MLSIQCENILEFKFILIKYFIVVYTDSTSNKIHSNGIELHLPCLVEDIQPSGQ